VGVEKKFVADGFTKALINEFLTKELGRAGYGGMVMNRTPMGTQIIVYAEKPGMVIGKGGKLIRKLTRDLDRKFSLDNPQIDVQDVGKAELNAQVVASRLASSLERGWYFRKASQSMVRRVMDSGALGCEIILSGKLTGPRSRTEKVLRGYIKHSGKPAQELVDYGYAVAVKKLGTIGCRVRIVQPDVIPPDQFQIVPPSETEETVPEESKDELEELLETEAAESVEGTEEAFEELAEEAVEEAPEEAVEEIVEEASEEAVEEIVEEASEEAVEEIVEEASEEAVEEIVEEASEEAVEEIDTEAQSSEASEEQPGDKA